MLLVAYDLELYVKVLLYSVAHGIQTSISLAVVNLLHTVLQNSYLCGYSISLYEVILKHLDRAIYIDICILEYIQYFLWTELLVLLI